MIGAELGKVYSDGEIIFREKEKGEMMFVIQAGKVDITKWTHSGEVTIASLGKGEVFGEMALFDKMPRSATAIAREDSRILTVDKRKFISSISRDPTLAFKILESMSQRIRRINNEFTSMKETKMDLLFSCLDVDHTCDFILGQAREIIPADNGSIMLLDPKMDRLEIKAAFGSEGSEKVLLGPGEGIAGHIIQSGQGELIKDVASDVRFKSGGVGIQSLVCVPLTAREFSFGVITLSRSSGNVFIEGELEILNNISGYASLAIQNAFSCSELQAATDNLMDRVGVVS
jgi:CRP/FNR family cyclic AMP-dependent transcriptional regulator